MEILRQIGINPIGNKGEKLAQHCQYSSNVSHLLKKSLMENFFFYAVTTFFFKLTVPFRWLI